MLIFLFSTVSDNIFYIKDVDKMFRHSPSKNSRKYPPDIYIYNFMLKLSLFEGLQNAPFCA